MAAQYSSADTRRHTVLVAVINNPADLQRAADEGWYRIPQRRAPRRIGADYLAFYQTGAFRAQAEAQTITFYAPTRRYRLVTRAALLPAEIDHPRATEYYYCIEIGPLQRLERPIPSSTFRRLTFIHTTLDRLLHASDIRDLYQTDDPFDQLWRALREHNLRPLRNRLVGDYPADITLCVRRGYLVIDCVDKMTAREIQPSPATECRERLYLSPGQITGDLEGCLRQIGAALIRLGGSVLNVPMTQ